MAVTADLTSAPDTVMMNVVTTVTITVIVATAGVMMILTRDVANHGRATRAIMDVTIPQRGGAHLLHQDRTTDLVPQKRRTETPADKAHRARNLETEVNNPEAGNVLNLANLLSLRGTIRDVTREDAAHPQSGAK